MYYLRQLLNQFLKNTTKMYLIVANIILVIFAIWFSNVGLLPFKNFGDFAFFAILALILGLYRPGWTFVFFIGALVLENVNLAPKSLGISLRPYQFFGFITIIALLVQIASKRIAFALPKFRWFDGLPIIFAIAGFLSSLGAINKGVSFKQSLIALTFVAFYFLVRIYVQSFEDLKRITPFFLSSGFIVMVYAIWQNVAFLHNINSFEVMLGRPNGTFTEADWLGIYLVFLLSVILTIIFNQSKKTIIFNFQFSIFNKFSITQFLNYLFLILIFITLILTVSRSAWVGAVFVAIVFLKFVLLEKYIDGSDDSKNKWQRLLEILKMQKWQWKKAGTQLLFILIALGVGLVLTMAIPLTRFQIANRAVSTGGLQKITIACQTDNIVPQRIENISELEQYKCRHINLEDIEKERIAGNEILEIFRPDPNVNIRGEIYKKSIEQIKTHSIFGLGWGGISSILGNDERGAGLNASNIFLEVWLGAGLLGFLSFVLLLGYILAFSIGAFLSNKNKDGITIAFIMLGWAAVVIPNLFNSGIFLGFVWGYLGVAIGLIVEMKTGKNI